MADERITASELKDIAKANGLISQSLKDSIASLSKMAKTYDTVIAKIDSMNRQTINTKKIQKELEAAQAKQLIAQKKYTEAQSALTDDRRVNNYTRRLKEYEAQVKSLNAATVGGNSITIRQQQYLLDNRQKVLDAAKSALQTEDLQYLATEESLMLSEGLVMETERRLNLEKELEKKVGIVGKLMGIAAKKLDIFNGKYEEIVENARDGNTTWLTTVKVLGGVSIAIVGAYKLIKGPFLSALDSLKAGFASLLPEGSKNPLAGITGAFSSLLKSIPFVGGLLGGVTDVLSNMLGILIGIDDTIVKAGRSLNMNTEQATALNRRYQEISRTNGDIYVTTQKLLQSRVELGAALGVNNEISEANLATDVKLKDIAGLELDTRAKILENSIISGQTEEDLVKTIGQQVTGLQRATGISLNFQKVLKEANNLGGYLGLAFSKYPGQVSKALVTTQALGLSLKELDGLADSFLDFESSIANEFEAQLLTGKELNLQTARRLFLENDLAGAAMEINKQVGSSADFLKINRIAAESLAKSFGMNRDQLSEMLRKQELLAKIGASQTSNAREQLKIGLERFKTQENLNAALGDEVYTNLVNASTQERIGAFLDKIKTSFIDFIENSGIVAKIESFMKYLSSPENMQKIISTIQGIVATGIQVMGYAAYGILQIADLLSLGKVDNDFIDSMIPGAEAAAARVRGFGESGTTVTPAAIQSKSSTTYSAPPTTSQPTAANVGNNSNTVMNIILKTDNTTIATAALYGAQLPIVANNSQNKSMSPTNTSVG